MVSRGWAETSQAKTKTRASFLGEVTSQPFASGIHSWAGVPHPLLPTQRVACACNRADSRFWGCVAGSRLNGFICSEVFSGRFLFHFLQIRGRSGKQTDQQTLLPAHPWDKAFPNSGVVGIWPKLLKEITLGRKGSLFFLQKVSKDSRGNFLWAFCFERNVQQPLV